MKSLKEELTYLRDEFEYRIFDISIQENWEVFAEELIAEERNVDLLINNAGMLLPFDKSVNYTEEQVHRCMNVNFHGCRYAIKSEILCSTAPMISLRMLLFSVL